MPAILSIADEFQARQVFANCEEQIGDSLVPFKVSRPEYKPSGTENVKTAHALYIDKILFYLWMCEQYGMKRHRAFLIEMCVREQLEQLEKSRFYKCVPASAMADFLNNRCKKLEGLMKDRLIRIEKLEGLLKEHHIRINV